jgi:hypothetical protein
VEVPVPVEQLTDELLRVRLAIILQEWPLYRQLKYQGAALTQMVPGALYLHCESPDCRNNPTTIWQARFYQGEHNKGGLGSKAYTCRNCGNSTATFHFLWEEGEDHDVFMKVGQHPELEERAPETLEKMLDADDLKIYKTAIRLRNFGLGLGAVAYLRRVIENRMNDLLDILYEAAKEHKITAEVLGKLEAVKNDRRFSVKVDYAGDLLPGHLRPSGVPNPMGILHELASDGIHARIDEDCVDIFDGCRETFEYVFGRLRIQNEEAKAFAKTLAELAGKKPKTSSL